MYRKLEKDRNDIDPLLRAAVAEAADYLEQLSTLPTTVITEEDEAPLGEAGVGGMATLEEFKRRYRPLMVASAGPRYWGFVTGGTTPAAIMGDMLTAGYDQNTQKSQGSGDVSARIELEVIRWLRDLFGLPHDYLGGLVTGATMSNFTGLAVARQWLGAQAGRDVAREGMSGPLPVLAAVPHSSSLKALAMLGLGSGNIRLVKTLGGTREAMDVEALEEAILAQEVQPFILISSGGTVNTVDYDDFRMIARLREKYQFWWHIDAAFGGFAALSPRYAHLLRGWEAADSITIDGHKWLNVPYESAFFFVKEVHKYLQVATFQNSNAPYLGDPLDDFNYLNFLPENSRRCKALPVWFTLRAYGKAGCREIVERNVALAQQLGAFIEESEAFELLAPVRLNTVCFSLREARPEKVQEFLRTLNERGRVFMTPTVFQQRGGIRAALVNWRTTDEDVRIVQQEMTEVFRQVNRMSL